MTKLDAGLITSLPASDPGSAAVWGSKRINPRPQFCLCLAWSGCPSNDDDDDNHDTFLLHLNVKSLNKNINKIDELLATLPYSPHVIIISETKLKKKNYDITFIKNYCFHSIDSSTNNGGIGIYLHNSLNYKIRPDLRLNKNLVEDIWVEIKSDNDNKSYIL